MPYHRSINDWSSAIGSYDYHEHTDSAAPTPSSFGSDTGVTAPPRSRPAGDRRAGSRLYKTHYAASGTCGSSTTSSAPTSVDGDFEVLPSTSDEMEAEARRQAAFREDAAPHVTAETGAEAQRHADEIEARPRDGKERRGLFRKVGKFLAGLENPLSSLVSGYLNERQARMEKRLGLPERGARGIEEQFSRLDALGEEHGRLLGPDVDNDSPSAKLRRKQVDIEMSMLIDDILTMLKQISQISKTANEAAVRAV